MSIWCDIPLGFFSEAGSCRGLKVTPRSGGDLKSNEGAIPSNYLKLVTCIYRDACARCPTDVSDLRDLQTIRSRVENEGLSFLTITLPRFCQIFEKSLVDGIFDPAAFCIFKKAGRLPAFLRGFVGRVFNVETGRIYAQTSTSDSDLHHYIDSIRQICLAFKKVELDCTPERERSAIADFVEIEHSFSDFSPTSEDIAKFLAVSRVLWDTLVFRLRDSELIPHHGPGGTADGNRGNSKFRWRHWHERLDAYFPLFDSAYVYSAHDTEEAELVTLVPKDSEQPAKVVLVPKTLKRPRTIAMEPTCMQYAQQGVKDILVHAIEHSRFSRGHVNFQKQDVNQDLARVGSKTGRLATIDLSDASDRVPCDLALLMFQSYPELQDAIVACRSTKAKLPSGDVIPLRKFASMGSALCFPVESMYFYTICVAACLESLNLPVCATNVYKASRGVWVYGDDIIVPTLHVGTVLDYLRKYNCKVNVSKSFWTGLFRESCGKDWYDGKLVTPTYIRKPFPENRQQADRIISWVETANLFLKRDMRSTADFMFNEVERFLGVLPLVTERSPALGRIWGDIAPPVDIRVNKGLQRPEVRAWIPAPVYITDRLEGYAALQKSLLNLRMLKDFWVSRDNLHLERSALHGAVALKRRWVPSTIEGIAD